MLNPNSQAYSAFLQSLFPFDNPPPPLKLSMSRLRLVSPLHRRLLRRLAAFAPRLNCSIVAATATASTTRILSSTMNSTRTSGSLLAILALAAAVGGGAGGGGAPGARVGAGA